MLFILAIIARANALMRVSAIGCCLASQATYADIPWPQVVDRLTSENRTLAKRPGGHAGTYFVVCTLYYTPKESGFAAERGFDVTSETRRGLGGRRYGRDFLESVRVEGIGRLAKPVNGLNYIRYEGRGRYSFTSRPTGINRSKITPRLTCAANRRPLRVSPFERVRIPDAWVQELFGSSRWIVGDTGGGLHNFQVDLYWGEDEPLGAGKLRGRPSGTTLEYGFAWLQVESTMAKQKPMPR
jgi:hypothetical protein